MYEHVEHPSHYNHYSSETISMMVAIWGKEKVADWCEITAFKYRMRMGTKPDNSIEQDLKKEQWYLNKAKELRTDCVELMDKQRKLDLEYRRFNHECVE